jgi:hypothetical protein
VKTSKTLAAIALAATSLAASATDYSDIWWNPAESGWGVNLAQSGDFIFATFFVYGPDNAPIWYSGDLTRNANGEYSGGLYATTGTYLGTVPFDPSRTVVNQVGIVTFQPAAADKGTLSYNVGNVAIVKSIERQALTAIPLAGVYTGATAGAISSCTNPSNNQAGAYSANVTVDQAAPNQIEITLATPGGEFSCTFSSAGSTTQKGPLFSFSGPYQCVNGFKSTVNVYELRATSLGIEGRWAAPDVGGGCREDGRFAAVLQ